MLGDLTTSLPVVLGRNLLGIYLYGSLTQRAFDSARSDVDCIVVTRRDLSDAQFARLDGWLTRAATSNPWMSRLQMTILVRDQVLVMNAPGSLYQFGRLARTGSDGNPIIWLNVLKSGHTLYGPEPSSFVPPITTAILHEALVREVGYLRDEIDNAASEWRDVPSYRVYAVLTLCRVLYSQATGRITSKPRAARWALSRLPKVWHPLIRHALELHSGTGSGRVRLARIRRFIEFVGTELHRGT